MAASQSDCESWIGDTKNEYCRKKGEEVTQTWAREVAGNMISYGYVCNYCGQMAVKYRFKR